MILGFLGCVHRACARSMLCVLVVTSILLCGVDSGGAQSETVSATQRRLGNQICNLTSGMRVRNPGVEARLKVIEDQLLEHSAVGERPDYHYRVLHYPTPTAFSVAPADVYVTTALLDMCDDEAELAVVLAREFSLLDKQNRAASIVGGRKAMRNVLMVGALVLEVAVLTKLWIETVEDPLQSSGITAGDYATISLLALPLGVMQLAHNSRIRKVHMAPRLRFGKDLRSSIMNDIGPFDTLLTTLFHLGESGRDELEADRRAFSLLTRAGYRADALVTLLEKSARIHTVELSRMSTASPGLKKRLMVAEEEAGLALESRQGG